MNLNRSIRTVVALLVTSLGSSPAFGQRLESELARLLHLIDTLPASLNALAPGAGSCRRPRDVSLADVTTFSQFACQADEESVQAWTRRQRNLGLDLLMLCGHCTPEGLTSVIRNSRRPLAAASTEGGLPPEDRWIVTPAVGPAVTRGNPCQAPSTVPTESCRVVEATYRSETHALSYLGTQHFYTLRTPEQRSAMVRTLTHTFTEFAPREVVLEGYPTEFPCERAVELYLSNEGTLTSEQDVMAWLALRNGVAVSGGEPAGMGLTGPDRFGLHILQLLASQVGACPRGELPPAEALISGILPQLRAEMGPEFPFASPADFLAWYQRYNGLPFNLVNAYQDMTPAPHLDTGVTPRASNRAFYEASLVRDNHGLRAIRSALMRSGRVLTVYGSGHLERTAPVLSAVMGTASPTPLCRD